jgi:hypothetical protein
MAIRFFVMIDRLLYLVPRDARSAGGSHLSTASPVGRCFDDENS